MSSIKSCGKLICFQKFDDACLAGSHSLNIPFSFASSIEAFTTVCVKVFIILALMVSASSLANLVLSKYNAEPQPETPRPIRLLFLIESIYSSSGALL